jgi:LacI family transcriptional regulator
LKLWKPDFIVMNDNFLTPEYYSMEIPIMVTPSRKLIPNVINIVADDEMIRELAAKYFINKGFKNLAFYGTDKIFWSKKRKPVLI